MIFLDQSNSLLHIVTNAIASFCIDHRLHQMAFFPSSPKWAKACFRVMLEYSEIKKAFRYYIKQIDSMLLCVCSVIDHRICQNVVRTSVTHLATPCVTLFCSYHILMSSVIYY